MKSQPVRILFVEDDLATQAFVSRFTQSLAQGLSLDPVAGSSEAMQRLKTRPYDVALIDYRFDDGTALDLLEQLGDIPSIFLTGPGEESIAAMVLSRGAYDYLMRDDQRNWLTLLAPTIRKVLARKKAERNLRDRDLLCQDLLNALLDIYLCLDEKGTILLANKSGAGQMGFTVPDLLGQSILRLVHPDDVERVKQCLLFASCSDDTHRVEFRISRKDGTYVPLAADVQGQRVSGPRKCIVRVLGRALPPVAKGISAPKAVLPPQAAVRQKPVPAPKPAAARAPAAVPALNDLNDIPAELKGTERVLVVDDQPEQRAIAARMLARMGYRVVTAENGRSAIEMMKSASRQHGSSPFDMVLLDMSMERDFDGLDTYRQLITLYPGQRCLLMSGSCDAERVRSAQSLGAGQFISKPYTFRTIGQAVRTELGKTSSS